MNIALILLGLLTFSDVTGKLLLFVAAIQYFWGYTEVCIELSWSDDTHKHRACVYLRRRDLNASNLTNVVSHELFEGGRLPNEVRHQIIAVTNPKTRVFRTRR